MTGPDRGPEGPPVSGALAGLRLDELLGEVQERLGQIVAARDRMQSLLDAVLAVGAGLELDATLRRIVQSAVDLVDARFGALGVLAPDGSISRFIDVGLPPGVRETLGRPPTGKGLLGQLILDPESLRLADLTEHPASVGFPPNHPPMHSFLGVPVRVRDEIYGNLYLTEKVGGGEFTADDEVMLHVLAAAAGIAVQNSDLFEQSRQRQHWLEALGEVRAEVLAGASDEEVLRLVAVRTLELTRSAATVVLLGPDEEGLYELCGSAGEPLGLPSGGIRAGADLDEVVESRNPLLAGSPAAFLDHGADSVPAELGPSVAVPMRSGERVIGVLVALRRVGGEPYRPTEVPLVTSFAEQAAMALEIAEKTRAQRQLDVLADRDRIARDLHDHVIQRLFATGLKLQSTLRRSVRPDVQDRIRQAVDELDETVREIRTSIFDLHGADQGGGGVRRRLLDTVDEVVAGSALVPSVRTSGPVDSLVPPELVPHLLAAVREGTSNAVRHSGGRTVTVTLEAAADLVLQIVDDGTGMSGDVARSGLHNLAERAEELGGGLDVWRRPGGGTRLTWRVPLDHG
ncbi:GAF domain-containing sensor histidine kinase [Pseudonocardia kujensis]|uniref:sensor histidine kinase n=1 Tax=Pseudonocardia kujensis TaxID=1128675 RepID=UPI001E4F3C8A|nr:GAF domain-containing sensor histidine kinase [Pseudonocardia kujensis]MCE0764453.1 GAF domain-containing sensor histidine kinase [Pseudonocardia kujensis]